MEHTASPHLTKLALGLVAIIIGYQLIERFVIARKRAAFARAHGALPAVQYPQRETIIGYELFKTNIRSLKARTFLEDQERRYQRMGVNTFGVTALGRKMHTTIEPENLKVMQATEFKKWGLGQRRKDAFIPFLGSGIFTTDGAAWSHSR
jgi:hypothetical protein